MKNVLITGGSSGIGYEISKRFAKNGFNIYWVSLDIDELISAKKELHKSLPEITIDFLAQDLTEEDGVTNVFEWIASRNITIDVLINNAGFGCFGYSSAISKAKEENMITLNVMSLYRLTRHFLDIMIAENKGTIINISSNTSLYPIPKMASYSATKAFVSHYSQALSKELDYLKSSVKIITICAAAVSDTQFKARAKMDHVNTFDGLATTTKKEVAEDVWKAFDSGLTYRLSGSKLRMITPFIKILPKAVLSFLIKWELSEKKKKEDKKSKELV